MNEGRRICAVGSLGTGIGLNSQELILRSCTHNTLSWKQKNESLKTPATEKIGSQLTLGQAYRSALKRRRWTWCSYTVDVSSSDYHDIIDERRLKSWSHNTNNRR